MHSWFRIARRVWISAVLLWMCIAASGQQTPGELVESGKFRLHKFEQAIGEETYEVRREGASLITSVQFEFTDRGQKVPLTATLRSAADLTPQSFQIKGKTSRLSHIDSAIEVQGGMAAIRQMTKSRQAAVPQHFFTISGYSPIAMQMMLVRYWREHGSPASLATLPQGEVRILDRGHEHVSVAGKRVELERYSVAGLIWGRESLWFDGQRLVAAVTTDAEFDHFEAVAEGYEPLLAQFVAEAGQDGMAVLAELARGLQVARQGPLAIVGATLIDGTGKAPLPDSAVVVEEGKIVAAGPRDKVHIPTKATLFDATGKFLLPGLWDMHAHFEQVEWGPIYLAAGVTTVRDVGNEVEFITAVRDALREGRGLGPQLLLAGVVDGSGPTAIGTVRVDSPEDAARWVTTYKKNGFQQMKIYSSMKLENLKAVCADAHRAGMTVTGHIPQKLDVFQAVEAGMNQVNHIHFLLNPLLPESAKELRGPKRMEALAALDMNSPEAQREVRFLKQHGTVVDPTIALAELSTHAAEVPVSSFEPGVEKVAPELAEPLTSGGTSAEMAPLMRKIFEHQLALIGALHRAGVTIVAGTDQAVPGHSLHREIELYVQAGFTPMEAIQAATLVPARVMGVDKEVGTVEVGKRADLALLDANPLEKISNIRSVKYVVAHGVLYDTAKLWQSVGFKP